MILEGRGVASRKRFFVLAAFLALVFVTGGASRPDAMSVLVLRPISVLVLGYAWYLADDAVFARLGKIWWLWLACALLLFVHVIPMPAALWGLLPGRDIARQVDAVARLGSVWRPLSMVPDGGWNALFSLATPGAVLLLAASCSRRELERLLLIVVGFGMLSAVLGIVQVAGPAGNPAYLYAVTNEGSAVGLFANRNHQALLIAMLFPLLALFGFHRGHEAQQGRVIAIFMITAAVLLIPLLLATGSRAGLVLGIVGLGIAGLVYLWRPRHRVAFAQRYRRIKLGAALALGVLLVGLSVVLARAEALNRLFATDVGGEGRTQFWGTIWRTAFDYFPFGSGAGSFAEAYQIVESERTMTPTYLNHAHNDLLEVWMTLGVPGILLVSALLWWWFVRARTLASGGAGDRGLALVALATTGMALLASLFDYPLRTPIHAALFALFAVVALRALEAGRSGGQRSAALPASKGMARPHDPF